MSDTYWMLTMTRPTGSQIPWIFRTRKAAEARMERYRKDAEYRGAIYKLSSDGSILSVRGGLPYILQIQEAGFEG